MTFQFFAGLPLYIILVPILGAVGSFMFRKNTPLRTTVELLLPLVTFALCIRLCSAILDKGNLSALQLEFIEKVPFAIEVDLFGALFASMAAGLWALTSMYALGYLRSTGDAHEVRFMSCLALSLSATFVVAFSANMLTLYLGYELLSFSTYPLVTHYRNDQARHAGRKYLFYILGCSIAFTLPAMIYFYVTCGSLDFSPGGLLGAGAPFEIVVPCFFLFLFGFAKAAVMPVHAWLPGAMVAPTPVSALLHAVAVVKVGVFSIMRAVLYLIGPTAIRHIAFDGFPIVTIGVCIASTTMLFAACVALSQDGLKRRLAYSTISQLAYIVLGTLLLAPKAALGAMLHIGVHAVSKITLFYCAGSVYVASKEKNVSRLTGIGWKMPLTMGAFTVGALSIIGFPLTVGFWSKWNLLQGSVESGYVIVAIFYLLGSLLASFYLLPILFIAYSTDTANHLQNVKEATWKVVAPLVLTAALCVYLFFGIDPVVQMLQSEVDKIFIWSF